jgi:hypothetical protein
MSQPLESTGQETDEPPAATRCDDWGDIRRNTGPTNTLYMLADEFDEIHGYWPASVPRPETLGVSGSGSKQDQSPPPKYLSDPTHLPQKREDRERAERDILDKLQKLYREFTRSGTRAARFAYREAASAAPPSRSA